jgi:UDP-N-acetylglucosamine acyltransferase
LTQDLPPFVIAGGNPAEAQSINAEGLRRRGYSAERITLVKQMYRLLYRKGLTLDAAGHEIEALRGEVAEADADIGLMQAFLSTASRGIVR